MEAKKSGLYDHPEASDLLFDGDSRAQQEFLIGCFQRYARRIVDRVLEPGCGTGRLLVRLAAAGYEVVGIDRHAGAVAYSNARLARAGFAPAARIGDMAAIELERPVDAAYNLINTFRHLATDAAALGHLRSMAGHLARGGVYVVGLHLLPLSGHGGGEEIEDRRCGERRIRSRIRSLGIDRPRREERIGIEVEVEGPGGRTRIEDEFVFRTYTWPELLEVVERSGGFELVATHDFDYDLESSTAVESDSEDVVVVLRRV